MWWMLFPRWIWFVLLLPDPRAAAPPLSPARLVYSHAGMCPNELNPNLWVDAMSTCARDCESDQDCEAFEKCCPNVCGLRSCVAARYRGSGGRTGPVGMPRGAACDRFMCPQQGSECEIWDGQPVCKCRDRCGREPRFTCASDGMTYYNRCYMDAEACVRAVSLSEVTCRFHFSSEPSPTAGASSTQPTVRPETSPAPLQRPVLLRGPTRLLVREGDTATFACSAVGRPAPRITWQKQTEAGQNPVMSPNHVQGNIAVTNIGQLVVYDAQLGDAGVYTCTASNRAGSASAHFPLSVVPRQRSDSGNGTRLPPEECVSAPDLDDCGDASLAWYYDAQRNSCFTFTYSQCNKNRNHFGSFQACMSACGAPLPAPCALPRVQGPCKAYAPRWAFVPSLQQCQSFVYGGCGGNLNNFPSREACEESCPVPRTQACAPCRPRHKMVPSFCRSDFVVLGRISELTEEPDAGHALVTVEEILKDEHMGLRFMGAEPLEVTLPRVDWSCPCPNVTRAQGQMIIMGSVLDGMALLTADSFVAASSSRRVRKLREITSKKTCDVLKEFSSAKD